MKKKQFVKLAIMGVSSGLLITNQLNGPLNAAETVTEANGCSSKDSCGGREDNFGEDNGNIGFHIFTEEELLLELNAKGEKLYMSLSDEGKELARKVASQRCNGTNLCKGLNACQQDSHACAGQGSCKGQGKCGFSDKNLAVKVVAMKMAKEKNKTEE